MTIPHLLKKHGYTLAVGILVLLLCAKFFWSYFGYDVPLGYDVGMYRYLFLRHATGFPPFVLGDMQEWAKGHPLGLFFLTSILLKIGLPVDWLIGWMWNAMGVLLTLCLAWSVTQSSVFTKDSKQSKEVFLVTLLIGTFSLPLYDGFVAMYWKTYVSLLFVVLTFALIDRKSPWAVATGMFALATHNQTGLLFILSVALWWVLQIRNNWMNAAWRRTSFLILLGVILGILFYVPVYQETIGNHFQTLFQGSSDATPEGAFPDLLYYWKRYAIILTLGAVGFVYSLKQKHFSLWHASVLWAAVFVFGKLFFYKRFFLHLDFFLLPFAALAFRLFWYRWKHPAWRVLLILMLCIQSVYLVDMMKERRPVISAETFTAVQNLHSAVPAGSTVVGLENVTALWIRGWLPDHDVWAPGFFDQIGTKEEWDSFIFGTVDDQSSAMYHRNVPLYFFLPPEYVAVYQDAAVRLLQHPCLETVEGQSFLYHSLCTPEP